MKKLIFMLTSLLILGLSACEKGGDGEVGPQGEKGEQGIAGVNGVDGVDGTKILSGTTVPAANLGANGDFYLRTSNSVLYGPKSTNGWGAGVSMKGANGATGQKGTDGTKLLSGTTAPTSALGANGDFYFHTTTGVLFGPKTSSGWGTGTSLKGPKGDKGDKGDPGNANVKVFEIGRRTFTGTLNIDLSIDYYEAIKMNMLVYTQYGNPVYQVPFMQPNFMVTYATYPYNDKFRVSLYARNPSTFALHTNQLTFPLTRIVFITATDITKIASSGVNLNDYNQVKAALKF